MASKKPASKKSNRWTRAAAKDAIVDDGLRQLMTSRPSSGFGDVSLAAAIERVGVPKPSGYRAFSHERLSPQQKFEGDVVVRLVQSSMIGDGDEVLSVAQPLLDEANETFQDASPDELAQLLQEAIRAVSAHLIDGLTHNTNAALYHAAALASGGEPADSMLRQALLEAETRAGALYASLHQLLASTFGLRLRTGWTWPAFTGCLASSLDGLLIYPPAISPYRAPIELATGPDGELQEWTALGLVTRSMWIAATEPDPRMVNSARLEAWLEAR